MLSTCRAQSFKELHAFEQVERDMFILNKAIVVSFVKTEKKSCVTY